MTIIKGNKTLTKKLAMNDCKITGRSHSHNSYEQANVISGWMLMEFRVTIVINVGWTVLLEA